MSQLLQIINLAKTSTTVRVRVVLKIYSDSAASAF